MNLDTVIFKGKSFSSLLEDIYKNQVSKEKIIKDCVIQLKDMITDPSEATLLVPLLKEYLEVAVKNDESLIKMAGIVQRAMAASAANSEDDFKLSDKELQGLYSAVKTIGKGTIV